MVTDALLYEATRAYALESPVKPVEAVKDYTARKDTPDERQSSELYDNPVQVKLSSEAKEAPYLEAARAKEAANSEAASAVTATSAERDKANGSNELSETEQRVVDEMEARDAEVRAHEQAHAAAAGAYAEGGPKYEYETGPDKKQYAVGGSVELDTSDVPNNPEATIQKAQVLRKAASAVSEMSGADRNVAMAAMEMEVAARQELREEKAQEREENDPSVMKAGSDMERERVLEAYQEFMPALIGQMINVQA